MNSVLAIALPFAFFGIFTASCWYVAWRLRTSFGWSRRWPLRLGLAAAFFTSMASMFTGARSTESWIGVVKAVGGYYFTFYLFLTLVLLVLHAVSSRWQPPGRWVAWSALGLASAITAAGALWAGVVRVNEVEIPLKGLEKDVVVMHISDVHVGHLRGRDHLESIVEETNRRQPDLILINGDLVDSDAALEPGVLSPLADFRAPVYFVAGNHENYVNRRQALRLIAGHGVRILRNEIVEIHGIQLVGLDYMNPDDDTFDMHPSQGARTIKDTLPNLAIDEGKPSLLMHHSPAGARYVATAGVDLMVSGHTHAGQMFPGTLFAPFIFPFNQGLYQEGDMKVFVSQGAGTFGPRIRLGTSNEINLIRLTAGSTVQRPSR